MSNNDSENIQRLIKIVDNMEKNQRHSVVLELDYLQKVRDELEVIQKRIEEYENDEQNNNNISTTSYIVHGGRFDK